MTNSVAMTSDELRALANVLESISDTLDTGEIGVEIRASVFDSNGEPCGTISNEDGFVFYYPGIITEFSTDAS